MAELISSWSISRVQTRRYTGGGYTAVKANCTNSFVIWSSSSSKMYPICEQTAPLVWLPVQTVLHCLPPHTPPLIYTSTRPSLSAYPPTSLRAPSELLAEVQNCFRQKFFTLMIRPTKKCAICDGFSVPTALHFYACMHVVAQLSPSVTVHSVSPDPFSHCMRMTTFVEGFWHNIKLSAALIHSSTINDS